MIIRFSGNRLEIHNSPFYLSQIMVEVYLVRLILRPNSGGGEGSRDAGRGDRGQCEGGTIG